MSSPNRWRGFRWTGRFEGMTVEQAIACFPIRHGPRPPRDERAGFRLRWPHDRVWTTGYTQPVPNMRAFRQEQMYRIRRQRWQAIQSGMSPQEAFRRFR